MKEAEICHFNRVIPKFQMLSQSLLSGMRVLRTEARRNFGIVAPALNKASDPIQQLFLDKVREYRQKSS